LLPRRISFVVVRVPVFLPASAAADRSAIVMSKTVVDKVPSRQGSGLLVCRSSSSAAAHTARRNLQPFTRGKLGEVAPLRRWSHDRVMHIGACLFVRAATARFKRVTHQESGNVEPSILRRYNISLQRDRDR
jgi:hypothetical protein